MPKALLALPLLALAFVSLAADPADPKAPQQNAAPVPKDPYAAYAAGHYDEALSGFLDRQMSRPDEPRLNLAVGSAHYQMKSFDEAAAAYAGAAREADPKLRAQALYNLGNVAFRQGKLEDAVKLYQGALDLDPNDQDAKFNLEFTRNEIRRRIEENKKRQEQQSQNSPDQNQDPNQPQDQEGSEDPNQPEDQPQEEGQQGDSDQKPSDQEQGGEEGQDGDQEQPQGQQPEAAQNPGQQEQPQPGEEEPGQGEATGEARPGSLTPEQAEQLLNSLSEGEPKKKQRGKPVRARGGKDW